MQRSDEQQILPQFQSQSIRWLTEPVQCSKMLYVFEIGLVRQQAIKCQTKRLHSIAFPTDLGGWAAGPASTPHNDMDPGPVGDRYGYEYSECLHRLSHQSNPPRSIAIDAGAVRGWTSSVRAPREVRAASFGRNDSDSY